MNFLAQKRPKILSKDTFSAPPAFSNPKKSLDFYYKEVANLTAAGGWRINFVEKTSFLDAEARNILNIPSDYSISLKSSLEFFAPEFRKEIIKAFFEGSLGKAYTGTVKMLTYDKNEIWTRVTSKPIYNKNNGVIGLQGIFQDITDLKQNEF